METVVTIIACIVGVAILGWFCYAFYHRVIKNEKADFTKRD